MIKIKHRIRLALALACISIIGYSQDSSNVQCAFSNTDSSYYFYGTYTVKGDINCLMNMCFDYYHISKLAPDAKEVTLVEQGDGWNKIKYVFQRFEILENTSVWYRKLNLEKRRVDFVCTSSINNNRLLPKLITSSGFYKFTPVGSMVKVEYYQNCKLEKGTIAKIYINAVKKGAVQFIQRLLEYSLQACGINKTT